GHCRSVKRAAIGAVEQFRIGGNTVQQMLAPFGERNGGALVVEHKVWFAPFFYDPRKITLAVEAETIVGKVGVVFDGTEKQKGIHETAGVDRNAGRRVWVDIQAAYLDILDAALCQRARRAFTPAGGPLGAYAGIVLVLDLDDIGIELYPLAVSVRADSLVIGPWRRHGVVHALQKGFEIVVAQLQFRLCLVTLVAQVAHAQAGRVGQVECVVVKRFQLDRWGFQKALGYRGRTAEQIHQQPGIAREVADQRHVAPGAALYAVALYADQFPEGLGHREIVVYAG